MKKLIVLLIVLTMVNVASAGIVDLTITSRNGVSLTTGVKEIGMGGPGDLPLAASDTVDMRIMFNAPVGQYLFGISSLITVTGNATLDWSHFVVAQQVWDPINEEWIWQNVDLRSTYDRLLHAQGTVGGTAWIVEGATGNGTQGNGVSEAWIVKNIYLHCEGPGNVTVALSDYLPGGGTKVTDINFQPVAWNYGAGVIIHQTPIPEPITLTLLGLGSLFLARRKK